MTLHKWDKMLHNERQIVEKYLIKYNAKINQNLI